MLEIEKYSMILLIINPQQKRRNYEISVRS